ncbi:MAG TPA: hypothetical protein VHU18_12975 [Rhizomicrobium sp.]|nr:hypothetical protein [Rhizomicrobium sp.]
MGTNDAFKFRVVMTSAMEPDELIGKYILVGIIFLDKEGRVVEQFQTYGPVVLVDDNKGIVLEKTDGSGNFCIPPDLNSLRPAPKGQYRLRSTGEILDDPDFISTWTVEKTRVDTIEEYKRSGFANFDPRQTPSKGH